MYKKILVLLLVIISMDLSAQDTLINNATKLRGMTVEQRLAERARITRLVRKTRAIKLAEKLRDSLGLTNNQTAQIEKINLQAEEDKQTAFEGIKEHATLQNTIRSIEKQRYKQYQTVLNKEQLEKYKKIIFNIQ